MKKTRMILAVVGVAALAACAQTPLGQATQACVAYHGAQSVTAQLKADGKLNPAQVRAFQEADTVAVQACTSAPPTTSASAAALAARVGAETAVLAAINKEYGK